MIYYHDLIYNIGSTTNEEDTAYLVLQYIHTSKYAAKLIHGIMCTKYHQPNEDPTIQLLLDLDLSGFAEPNWLTYLFNTRKIYEELLQFYPISTLIKDRYTFLTNLLSRKHLYSNNYTYNTPTDNLDRNYNANINIEREIKQIETIAQLTLELLLKTQLPPNIRQNILTAQSL